METLSNLCRCCLSPDSQVSILDKELDTKAKFFETTSIEVKDDDGLPQKLCADCFTVMNSAYHFRTQCIKMDTDLKAQIDAMIQQTDTAEIPIDKEVTVNLKELKDLKRECEKEDDDEEFATNPLKQLEAIIKKEPDDSDEDCYYVLVIDDNKEKGSEKEKTENIVIKKESENEEKLVSESFHHSVDSYLVTGPKIPDNVPATILENEEEYFDVMDIDEDLNENNNSQDLNPLSVDTDNSEDIPDDAVQTITASLDGLQDSKKIIKILTTGASDGKILLKGTDSVAYLADPQLEDQEDDSLSQEEVIVYEEGEGSQFLVNCDGELVIEYADESQIATVLQQEDGTFLCVCGEQFEDLSDYEKHQYTHSIVGEHLCNLCGKGFESAEILTGHKLLHKYTSLFITCPFCNQLIRRNSLTQHIKHGHNNIKPKCKVCTKTFANPNNLKRHMMIHSGVRQFECDICFKRFHQKITMQTHRLTHIDPFACTHCEMSFQSKSELDQHKENNDCSKSKVARIRDELIKTVKQVITISTQQGKVLGYACSLCKKMFSVESALEEHVESNHMVDPMELFCAECGEVLPSKKEMISHTLTHKSAKNKNMKRFECGICGKGCSSQAMLIMHERVHTNERPYPCQLCALRFKTKTHLRTHQLTHTREKKFGCSICMKFFALKGNLVVHLRTHTGERPYVCNLCGEAFIDSKYLKKHKKKKHAIDNVPWNKY